MTPMLTVLEVAERLSISRSMAWKLIAAYEVPSIRVGRAVRVQPEDLDAYIAAHVRLTSTTKGRIAMNGVELIAAERQRQIEIEGWDAAHDRGHADELAQAGATYALPPRERTNPGWRFSPVTWPWAREWWKPGDGSSEGRIRELVKAGALIAAAIDSASEARGEPDETVAKP